MMIKTVALGLSTCCTICVNDLQQLFAQSVLTIFSSWPFRPRGAFCRTRHCRPQWGSCMGCRLLALPRQRSTARRHWTGPKIDWTRGEVRRLRPDIAVLCGGCSAPLAASVGSRTASITTAVTYIIKIKTRTSHTVSEALLHTFTQQGLVRQSMLNYPKWPCKA